MRWMTTPAVAGRAALHVPLIRPNLNPRDRRRKRRRGRRKKSRKRKRQKEGGEKVKIKAGSQSRAVGTAGWRGGRWRSGTWAWASTRMRSSSSSSAWAPASRQEQTMTWRWGRCWRTARCRGAPPARSATTLAAGPTGTSQSPSWTPRPRGGPSSRYRPPAACAWAEKEDGGASEGAVAHVQLELWQRPLGYFLWSTSCLGRRKRSGPSWRMKGQIRDWKEVIEGSAPV